MYFSNKINLIPDVEVHTTRTAPDHVFGKILHVLSAGLTSPKDQKLAFTAVTILQNINRAFRAQGITNIVRLAKDGYDFYHDHSGRENDMAEAMQNFVLNNDDLDSELFNDLYLVVEHENNGLKFLIEADITRSPTQNQPPIVIAINAIVTDFKQEANETNADIKEKLKPIFASNVRYNQYVLKKSSAFESFVNKLQLSLRSSIKVKDLSFTQQKRIVRRASANKPEPRNRKNAALVHQGYYGYDDYSSYTWYWSDMCHDNHILISDTELVSDDQSVLWSVGPDGIDASDSAFFDSEQTYDSIEAQSNSEQSSSSSVDGSTVAAGVAAAYVASEVIDEGASSSSWLSGIFGDSSDSDNSSSSDSDSGSSCSSCSSCGGD